MKTVHLSIKGKVQGVWYRAWTRETALELNLNGWVRNRSDRSVEALVSGEQDLVAQLIEKCWSGPKAARVDNIIITDTDEEAPAGFRQEPTL
ncbi:acylphosphatase [Candidatus Terasakiella magnetica]|uniref:acylphosphatase n=1 Tax=Candidatus Terasakiella magnetica TaxID=1867952 RepID=UPI000840C786|nr:acylphosphatase [Candidatus Terasakiella magnetica]